jgi:predicted NUDIX family NTP pyrophosphohydrolase
VTTDKSGRTSAGILLWRRRGDRLEVLLAHMGGPSWVNKDLVGLCQVCTARVVCG